MKYFDKVTKHTFVVHIKLYILSCLMYESSFTPQKS